MFSRIEGQEGVQRGIGVGLEGAQVLLLQAAHGTGTELGDPIEVAALHRVFGGQFQATRVAESAQRLEDAWAAVCLLNSVAPFVCLHDRISGSVERGVRDLRSVHEEGVIVLGDDRPQLLRIDPESERARCEHGNHDRRVGTLDRKSVV